MKIESKKTKKKIEELVASNKGRRINIRIRPGKEAITIFLDYYSRKKHYSQFYPTRIIGRIDTEEADDRLIRIVRKDREDKEWELMFNKNPFLIQKDTGEDEFLPYFEEMSKNRPNRPSYQGSLKHFKDFTKSKSYRFCDLNSQLFEDFKNYLLKRIGVNTTVTYLDALRATLNKAVKEKIITDSPMKEVRLKEKPVIKEYLSEEEIVAIINCETEHIEVKNAFLFSCFTGLRKSDVIALTFDKIRGENIYFIERKTQKEDYLPLSMDALEIIKIQKERHPDSASVFHLGHKSYIQRKLRIILNSVGITRKVTYHSSRHTFAVRSLESGMDSHDVKNFLGHSKIETTEVYLKFATSQKRQVIDRVPTLIKRPHK